MIINKMPRHILLINGPNLNLLGTREPGIYGSATLADVEASAQEQATALGITLETFQSNHEGAIVDRIQQAGGFGHLASRPEPSATEPSNSSDAASRGQTQTQIQHPRKPSAIIINAGALTHTSIAVRDALLSIGVPFVELHVSNVHAREPFRAHSYLSDKAVAVICGMGAYGYTAAIEFVARHLKIPGEE